MRLFPFLFVLVLSLGQSVGRAAEPLKVVSDFEGASVREVEIDQETRTISFMPGGDPLRGWPCWWYFRVDGLTPGEAITLKLRGSSVTVPTRGKPLGAEWAMPAQATFSTDGKTWLHTAKGKKQEEWMNYSLQVEGTSAFVAWGPPYTPGMASAFVKRMAEQSPYASADELCRSRGDRPVPMLHVMEGDRKSEERFGVWIQARQHAWESGSSWVAQGFTEWLLSEEPEAAWLRQHAEIFIVPIMDIDNTATGNGGKDAQPHDHNRDWSAEPHWNEIIAAQRKVQDLAVEDRMDVFVDLHNPAPGDPTFFYILPSDLLKEPMIGLRDQFIQLSYARISNGKSSIPMSSKSKTTGPSYHPLWHQMSATWVCMNANPHTVSLCLETAWNTPHSTTEGYREVGANLAATVQEFLAGRPTKP